MDSLLHLAVRALDPNGIDPQHNNTSSTDPMYIGMARRYCTVGKCPESWQTIKYRPSIAGNVIYMLCFLALLGGQLWFGIRNRTWTFTGPICLGVFGEIIGYIGRILLYVNPFLMNNFLVNLIPLTLAPALITAGIYLCLGRVLVAIGSDNSRLKPKMYSYIFIGCDVLALILQGVGGGLAATAKDTKGSRRGVNIMIAGLVSQVVTMSLFFALWADFTLRTRRAKLSGSLAHTQPPLYEQLRGFKTFALFQWALFAASVFIYVRCIYRVAELWDGFNGHLANDQATFMVFEGPMMILAVLALTVFHPGRVFGDLWVPAGKGVRSMGKLNDEREVSVQLTETEWNSTAYQRVEQPNQVV
ncbi:hypothetical protein ACEQ8H_002977 [Pleosporales sp. CAS-2024a]